MKGELTREKALKALNELFDRAFGHDKGSDEAYTDFCIDMGLCEFWDGEAEGEEYEPPGQYEILEAAGLTPQVCPHGQLPRSCQLCEYEARIAELEGEIKLLTWQRDDYERNWGRSCSAANAEAGKRQAAEAVIEEIAGCERHRFVPDPKGPDYAHRPVPAKTGGWIKASDIDRIVEGWQDD